jgi:hypothetical protein
MHSSVWMMMADVRKRRTLAGQAHDPVGFGRGSGVPLIHTFVHGVVPGAHASTTFDRAMRLMSWSLTAVVLAIAPTLHAEGAPSLPSAERSPVAALKKGDAPVGAVRISISTNEERLLLTVAQPGASRAIVTCYYQCSFWGVPGRYTVWTTNQERGIRYQTTLDAQRDRTFLASSGNPGARTAGMIAGIAGPIAMVGGVALAVVQVLGDPHCDPSPGSDCVDSTGHPLGYALFAGGLVATVIGWLTFATSGPRVDAAEEKRETHPPLRARLGVTALPSHGWGMAISTPF